MSFSRPALVVLALFSIPAIAAAQQPPPASTPQRDPQALSVLTQCLTTAGGTQVIAAIQDYTANGTITYYWAGQEVQGTATARGRGTGQFRLDASVPGRLMSLTANKGIGSVKQLDGSAKPISYLNAINLGSLTFPFSKLLAALQDSSLTVSYLGLADESGRQAHRIQVRKDLPAQTDPGGLRSKASIVEFFIDNTTLQLVKTFDWFHPEKWKVDHMHEVHFSDYRPVNGVLVPFLVRENVGGAKFWTLQLNQISFNNGLKDSDFQQ